MNATLPGGQQAVPALSVADDEIDLRDLFAAISGGRWILLAVTTAFFVLGAFYGWTATRVYDADALVQVEKEESGFTAALGDMAEFMGQPSSVTAEVELLKSRMIVGSVVDSLQLAIVAEPNYCPIVGRAMARRFQREADGPDVGGAFFGLRRYAWGGEFIRVSSFDVPNVLVGQPFELEAVDMGFALLFDGHEILRGAPGTRIEGQLANGRKVAIFVQELTAAPGTTFTLVRNDRTDAIERIQKNLRVSERGKDSGILQVSYSSSNPVLAREVVNRLMIAYQRQNIERKSAEAAQTLAFLEGQLPEIREKLEGAESSFNTYRLREGSADLTKETELILQQSVELETVRLQLEQKRTEALQRFTANHPTIVAIDRQLQSVRDEQQMIGNRVKGLPETQQELLRLARDVEVNTTLYTNLLNNYQELQVVRAGTIGNVRIIDYAVDARAPSKPKLPLILALSVVLGAFAGIAVIFVRRALKPAINDPSEVERSLGIPTYATVPFTPAQRRLLKRGREGEGQLLAFIDPQNIAVEALRSLRTSLHFAMMDSANNVLMLTGPGPGLGKSFISINLGAVLAMSGKRVVIVDADLRRGHLNEYVNCQRSPGLSDYCAGQTEIKEVLRRTVVDGLWIVPTGLIPPNPAELLLTDRFAELVKALSQNFDYVVIDTPPILAVTDAAIVGKVAGSTLVVLKAGEHSLPMIQETVSRLQNAGVKVSGTIFNQVGRPGTGYAGYRYGYAYQYSYKSLSTSSN
jgi:tyrosine-protein kinase Etk/Wzc